MSHLSSETVAAYLDRTVSAEARAEIDAHLAECPRCRAELVHVRGILRAERRRRRKPALAAWGVAAAAVVAVLFVLPLDGPTSVTAPGAPAAESPFRAAGEEAAGPEIIESVDPVVSPEGASASVLLRWRPVAGASEYRVTLTDGEGSPAWSGEVADTFALVPASVSLTPGAEYFWFADATLSDGTAVSTGIRSFVAR